VGGGGFLPPCRGGRILLFVILAARMLGPRAVAGKLAGDGRGMLGALPVTGGRRGVAGS
jgi:hypothetical protein